MTNSGEVCSDIGKSEIKKISECRNIPNILSLAKSFEDDEYNKNHPTGCYLYSSSMVYWNNHPNGSGDALSQAICKENSFKGAQIFLFVLLLSSFQLIFSS